MSVQDDLSPSALPFDAYVVKNQSSVDVPHARDAHHAVAMAKRMLLQERVQSFTAADVVALAGLILAGGK